MNDYLEYNIESNLAAYMTLTLDPSSKDLVDYMITILPIDQREPYIKLLNDLSNELDNLLSEKDISLADLFFDIGIK